MNARLRMLWQARSPRERVVLGALAAVIVVGGYVSFVQSAEQARGRLAASVLELRASAARLDRQARELRRLRGAPAPAVSRAELRSVVRNQAGASGLSSAIGRLDAPDANRVVVSFGAVAFSRWLQWVAALQAQRVRLAACRIVALSAPGMVSVTATLERPQRD